MVHLGGDVMAAYDRLTGQRQENEPVKLPQREQDVRPGPTNTRHLLPFSPDGSQRV